MRTQYKNSFLEQGKEFYSTGKRNNAKQIYERVLRLDLEPGERNEVNKRLLEMYEKLGNVREYMSFKKTF